MLTPSLQYYDFEPVSQFISDLRSDQINRFFIGLRQIFTISGRLVDQQGNGLPGMNVALAGATEPRTSVTDGAGNYQFPNLTAGFDYTVTPQSTAVYVFMPRSFIDLDRSEAFDFTGLHRYILSGKVRDQSGSALGGVRLSLTGSESATVLTDLDGSYSLPVIATGDYTVTPSVGQDWFTFAPAAATFNNLAGGQTTDFTATLAPVPDPSLVLAFDGDPKTVDYGNYWPEGVNLGHFFWEFGPCWALTPARPTCFRTVMAAPTHSSSAWAVSPRASRIVMELLGNLFDGVRFDNYFGSDQGPAIGEWAHLPWVGTGKTSSLTTTVSRLVRSPFAGPRRSPGPGGGGGRLLIGGSDHSNFDGRIAEIAASRATILVKFNRAEWNLHSLRKPFLRETEIC